MADFEIEGKTNLFSLEGEDEVFVDCLSDIGVFDIQKSQEIVHGTYANTFSCTDLTSSSGDDDGTIQITTISANYYEIEVPVSIKVVKYLDSDGEELDKEAYWLDEEGNDIPSQHPAWSEILENMDIFLDEM